MIIFYPCVLIHYIPSCPFLYLFCFSRPRVSKLLPSGQIWPGVCFCKESFIGAHPHSAELGICHRRPVIHREENIYHLDLQEKVFQILLEYVKNEFVGLIFYFLKMHSFFVLSLPSDSSPAFFVVDTTIIVHSCLLLVTFLISRN